MRLAIMSDLHLEFERRSDPMLGLDAHGHPPAGPSLAQLQSAIDAVVLAGDIDLGENAYRYADAVACYLEVPVVLIAGNHEFYGGNENSERRMDRLIPRLQELAAGSEGRVHFLERESAIISGTRFLGCVLWSNFRLLGEASSGLAMRTAGSMMNDFRLIDYRERVPFDPEHAIDEFESACAFMTDQLQKPFDGATVVVTHHAPSPRSVQERYRHDLLSAAFASDLDELVAQSGAELWIHGHMHDSVDEMIGETRLICNPRGYWPNDLNLRFDASLILEV